MLTAVAIGTNTVDVTFNEAVLSSSLTTNNLRVIRSGTSELTAISATVTSIVTSARVVRLRLRDWDLSRCYYVQANTVTDSRGTAIAPDSVIGVVMPGGAIACAVPPDPPLAQLRLSIDTDADGTRISWPPGYHGFALMTAYDLGTNGVVTWRPTINPDNGQLIAPGPNRFFQLRKFP
jgi:hypothetical protein